MSRSKLRLGTRRSLLAWAQSSWVAREVEKLNPGVQVELVGIETQGDRIQDISLRKVEGKEFFVAEIDQALLRGEVDFTVHSLKDLSLDRPTALRSAAIPRRVNPRDVIVFGPHALERLKKGESLQIGTSSPRRLENIPDFLKSALPRVHPEQEPILEWVEIRGNVNTRLSRVHEPLDSPKYLDAVVLAFAGMIRLWADTQGRAELSRLLTHVRWMVLPLQECPAAPGQGALAVECRADDHETFQAVNKLHDLRTARQISAERQILSDWGGGCHQRFGATAIEFQDGKDLLWIRGVKSDESFVQELRWTPPQGISEAAGAQGVSEQSYPLSWDGSEWKAQAEVIAQGESFHLAPAVFVAHHRALTPECISQMENRRVWTSGTASWFKLASQGVWVEGCAEGLGFEGVIWMLYEKVLGLPELTGWSVLTHQDALEDWVLLGMKPWATYKLNLNYRIDAITSLKQASFIFWSSGTQINRLLREALPNARHACGSGKTAAYLRDKFGIEPDVFPSADEWRMWVSAQQSKGSGE
jgi:hydroxymethylbilane synthase